MDYTKKKSLEDINFMKEISNHRDQSEGQLNKILSDSSIQTFNINKNHSTKAPITSDLQNVVGDMQKQLYQLLDQTVSKAEFDEQKNELSEIKQMVLELSKIVKNQATNKQ